MSRIADAVYGDRPYPDSPGWKEPTTSRDAAKAVSNSAPHLRERVYAVIRACGGRGMTADEVAAALGETVLATRPRLSELAKATPPRIIRTGERRKNDSGLSAAVWRAV